MARPHARSGDVIALRPLGASLAAGATHALLKASQLEVVRLVLPAGRTLPTHAAPGEITILGLEGTIALTVGERRLLLSAGDLVHLEAGAPHAVEALDDASALLTLCLQPAASASAS